MPTPADHPIPLPNGSTVSALALAPPSPVAVWVLAHGAGAGMTHPFMAAVAEGLCERGVATLRFQFPFMERGSRRADPPGLAHTAVRAAVADAGARFEGVPLFAGGKSYGGRMSSQTQAEAPLPGVKGLVFLGFPLHPAGKPSVARAAHLADVALPMLFLQGTRDTLAALDLLRPQVQALGARATLHEIEGADHAFHVLRRSGRTDAQVLEDLLDTTAAWMGRHARAARRRRRRSATFAE